MDYLTIEDLKASENLVNKEAEYSVLGTFIVEPETQNLLDTIQVSLFTGIEKTIAQSLKNLHNNIEEITLVELIEEVKKYDNTISVLNLSSISTHAVAGWQQRKNIKILENLSKKRTYYEYLKKAEEKAVTCLELDEQVFDLMNKLESLKTQTKEDVYNDINKLIEISMDRINDDKKQIHFGYKLLDDNIGGIKKGELTIIGGKSGVGKSTLALNIALNVLEQGKKVLYISREMSDVDLFDRLISMVGDIPNIKFKNKSFDEEDWKKYIETSAILSAYNNLMIIDNESDKISQITSMIRENNPDLVIIDYLQLLDSEYGEKNETHEQQLAKISRAIRKLTMKYDCHILALVQLNNNSRDSMPRGENVIRQSSSIYQDATAVVYIHEPLTEKEMNITYRSVGEMDSSQTNILVKNNLERKEISTYSLILDKNRNGATRIEPLIFLKSKFKMYDYTSIKEL